MNSGLIKDFTRLVNIVFLAIEYTRAMIVASETDKINITLLKYLIKDAGLSLLTYSDVEPYAASLIKKIDASDMLADITNEIAIMSELVSKSDNACKEQNEHTFLVISDAEILKNCLDTYSEKYPQEFANIFAKTTKLDNSELRNEDKKSDSIFTKLKKKALDIVGRTDASGDVAEAAEEALKVVTSPPGLGTIISGVKAVRKTVDAVVDVAKDDKPNKVERKPKKSPASSKGK